MRLRSAYLPLLLVTSLFVTVSAPAQVAGGTPGAAFTDSAASGLLGTRKVAITSVVIAFQASTGAQAGARFFVPMLTSRDTVQTMLAMPNMKPQLQDVIAEAAYRQLAAQLTAAGYEVLPREQVTASATYRAIVQQAGYASHSRYANAMGDVMLVSPPGLAPYTPYNGETGNFVYPSTSYLGWISGFGGKSETPDGLSIMKQSNAWKVPGLEVALARELGANIVKATYVVSLGKADARRSTSFSVSQHSGFFTDSSGALNMGSWNQLDRQVTGTGTAFAQVGLVADQTHIAFRTPGGNAKWQKVAMTKIVPPKDGDVVVRITDPVLGSTDIFNVRQQDFQQAGGLVFSSQKRGDINVAFYAEINDEKAYGEEVINMFEVANKAMISLVPAS